MGDQGHPLSQRAQGCTVPGEPGQELQLPVQAAGWVEKARGGGGVI